jgi:hypothetical protein
VSCSLGSVGRASEPALISCRLPPSLPPSLPTPPFCAAPLGGRFSKLKMVVLAATLIILGLVIGLAVGLHGTNSSGSNGTALGSATGQTGSESEGELPEFVTNSTSSNSTSSSTPAPSPASQGGPTTPLEPTPEPLNPPSLTPAPAGGTPNPTPWSRATPAPTAPPTVPDGGSIYEAYYSQPQSEKCPNDWQMPFPFPVLTHYAPCPSSSKIYRGLLPRRSDPYGLMMGAR